MKVSRTLALISWICVAPLVISAHAQLMQVAELTASDGAKNDNFGTAVALAGSTTVVGTPDSTNHDGAAYVFDNTGGSWAQVAKLTASDASRNQFLGTSVGISSDGGTIVAGAPGSSFKPGAVYVFVKPQSGWADMTETAKLTVDSQIAAFGARVAVSRHGNTVVAVSTNSGGFVFVEPPGGWANLTKQTATLEAAAASLSGVAVNGNTVAISATQFSGNTGAVFVYILGPGSPMPQIQPTATLTGSDQACGPLGISVAIDSDTIVAGAPSVSPGWVCVFVKPPSGWVNMTQSAELSVSTTAQLALGFSVAILGHAIATGAPASLVGQNVGQGAFYGYAEPPGGWVNTSTPSLERTSNDGATEDQLGWSIAASGRTVIVSTPFHAVNGNAAQGAAYVFSLQ